MNADSPRGELSSLLVRFSDHLARQRARVAWIGDGRAQQAKARDAALLLDLVAELRRQTALA